MKLNMHKLALLTAFLLLAGCSKTPEGVIEGFYGALSRGEITESKEYISAQLIKQLGDAKLSAVLTKEAQHITECGGIKSVEVKLQGEGEIRNGTTVVTYTDETACKQKTEKSSLVKEDGSWKITANK